MNQFSTKISRRMLLRGAGVAMGLPLLDAMVPLARAAATVSPPVRIAWVFFPNGTNSAEWLPNANGSSWDLTKSLEPLAEHKPHLTAYRGLAQMNGFALGDGPGDHARSAASFLTGAHPFKSAGSNIKVGRSIDQILADRYGQTTRLPSIELGTEEGRQAGDCDSGYSCAYSSNISWRSESQPMAKEINPRRAFKRIFGGGDNANSTNQSVIDAVLDSQKRLVKQVGINDRQKLDQYFTSVREIEKRLERLKTPVDLTGIDVQSFQDEHADSTQQIRMMYDLMVLAFRTDATRIATFMLANESSNRSFPMIDVKEGHHELSHHQNKAEKMQQIAKIDRYYSEQFSYFLNKMREIPDGDGKSLLDNSLIVYGGSISDGNRHDHNNLPILLAGHGGGKVQGGRIEVCPDNTPLNNLYLAMSEAAGASVPAFGDSTSPLSLS